MPRLSLPLKTRRLRLRDFEPGDLPAVRRYALDPRVLAHIVHDLRTEQELNRHFATVLAARGARPRRAWELAVELQRSGELIGTCDLARHGGRDAELGYLLDHRFWGRGYATELVVALIDAAFGALPIARIRALIDVDNDGSRRVLEKAGLYWAACHRRHAHARGRWWDCDEYEIERRRWLATVAPRAAPRA